jgi:citrate lyase subunit beta / citryl-CoA lyase
MNMTALSYLFVPADRPQRFAKALSSGAHAVIVDLEDAVSPDAKQAARAALAEWLTSPDAQPVLLRVNGAQTAWFADDLRLCALPAVGGVVLPKTETVDDVDAVRRAVANQPVLPLIETAAGIANVRPLARAEGVQRLLFGSIDFQADLGIEDDDQALLPFRSELVLASRLAGLPAPVDGVTVAIEDEAAVAQDTARARRLGFGAKLCIHPRQVAVVHQGFLPRPEEVDWARSVLAAVERSAGAAVAVDGKMVDAPVLLRAEALLARTQQAR